MSTPDCLSVIACRWGIALISIARPAGAAGARPGHWPSHTDNACRSLIKGMIPLTFQLPRVRRLIGNLASSCFSSMKPVSFDIPWLRSWSLPLRPTFNPPDGIRVRLNESFCSNPTNLFSGSFGREKINFFHNQIPPENTLQCTAKVLGESVRYVSQGLSTTPGGPFSL